MAELSRFFNSVEGDERTYQANDFAQFFSNFLGNGFFEGLAVSSENTMNTIVAPGSAFIEGHEYTNTTSLTLTHDPADSSNDRIDRVVLRLNRDIDVRAINAFVKKGDPGSNPEPPDLTRNDYVWELSLAQVRIEAGKSYIDSSQITDERGDHEVCGRVQVARQVGDQINTVDIKPVEARPEEYAEGISQFYISGSSNTDLFQEWMDSIGISASDYSRSISSLRAYVHTIGNRTNTGVQTFTLFDYSAAQGYKIYGEFKRANNAVASSNEWGQWQEASLIVEQGVNSNGEYIRYSDGTQFCRAVVSPENDMVSAGAIYRMSTQTWTFPAPFVDSDVVISGSTRSYTSWFDTTGAPSSDSVGLTQFRYSSGSPFGMNVMAWGRWR